MGRRKAVRSNYPENIQAAIVRDLQGACTNEYDQFEKAHQGKIGIKARCMQED